MPKTKHQTLLPEITDQIKNLREQKGRENEVLALVDRALEYGYGFIINLLWEKALTYQHVYMNNTKDKTALEKMERSVSEAKFYIEKYELKNWYSRLYRFLGRVSDYKGQCKKSVGLYEKAIKSVGEDNESFRILELESMLSSALIMAGRTRRGLTIVRRLFKEFDTNKIGRYLKKNDYQTWAIWRSGLVIRTVEAFIDKKVDFDKKEIKNWLWEIEKDLSKGDFSYRKKELEDLKLKLN